MNEAPAEPLCLEKETLAYSDTGHFSPIVLDYLADKAELRPFYTAAINEDQLLKQGREKLSTYAHRGVLLDALRGQYRRDGADAGVLAALESERAVSITTGHQLCFFTGPLYFLYKIVTVVNACARLNERQTDLRFVPVFWMASEDHDFDEANHFWQQGERIAWESGQGGAVGRMRPEGMAEIEAQLRAKWGMGYHAGELLALFRRCYAETPTLAAATRRLIHSLFGADGVVVVDGDDRKLKGLMRPIFEAELLHSEAYEALEEQGTALARHYALQVHPRPINLFYLADDLRERIVRVGDQRYEVLRTGLSFTQSELLEQLRDSPEKFSPNVVMRPLYQEVILPNVAYVGGGGELAYWFQLGKLFETQGVAMPLLLLRNSALLLREEDTTKLKSLGLSPRDLFGDLHSLERKIIAPKAAAPSGLDEERAEAERLFTKLEGRLMQVEKGLAKSVRSAAVRSDHMLLALEKKLIRAEKRRQGHLLQALHTVYEHAMPGGGLQERKENFSTYYLRWGAAFIEELKRQLQPFEGQFSILTEGCEK